jgi:hypothetical protein
MSIPSTPQFPKPLSSDHQAIKSAYNTGLAGISYFLNLTSKEYKECSVAAAQITSVTL